MAVTILQTGTILISQAESITELRDAVQATVSQFGLDSFNLTFGKQDKHDFMTDPSLTSWSPEDLLAYNRNGWGDRDPLLEYAVTGNEPLGWGIGYWQRQPGSNEYAHYLQSAGVRGGITIPLSGGPGKLGAFTALSSTREDFSNETIIGVALLARIALLKARALRTELPSDINKTDPLLQLSARQIEILQWASQGKSNHDISVILNQKKRTIDYHISEILRKMEISTRTQAVAIFIAHRSEK